MKTTQNVLNLIGNTPMLGLKKLTGGEIYAKAEFLNPGGSIKDLARPTIPPGGANGVYRTTLARDVESVYCEPTSAAAVCPLAVKINCRIPNGLTLRSETTVGNPNVALIQKNTIGGW